MQHTQNFFALICCAALALSACSGPASDEAASSATAAAISLIPVPRELIRTSGQFEMIASTPVTYATGPDAKVAAEYFVDLLQRTGGPALEVKGGASTQASIKFKLDGDASAAVDEAYTLDISPNGVSVSAADARGLFYGAVTLWQLIGSDVRDGATVLPAMTIKDAPRFRWRGVMLDSVRHYQSPEFIKRFIDVMATHKLNVLHWHLTDDQGWRIEIRKYPRLTEVGAWRVPAGQAPAANIDPATNRPRQYGGFYTQAQVRDIVAYAATRHITIVPEIEMPGHASAAIAAYPQLGVDGTKLSAVPSDWGVYPNLFNIEDSTFAFLEDVLTEVMTLFPSEYIHVGGDEAAKQQWQASRKIQDKMKALGIPDEHHLQSYFIQRIEKFLNSNGRRLIGWDEILEGGLAPNATVMSWRGIDGAIAAATAGHDTVLSPGPTLYFDNRPFDAPVPGRARLVTVEDVYRFDPAPKQLSEPQRKHVLGVQANLWAEHIRTEARLEYMAFPRLAALSEVAWSDASRIDFEDFEQRLPAQLHRYTALGIQFARAEQRNREPGNYSSHDMKLCSENIAISLEDDAPIEGPRTSFLVDIMNPCWIVSGADLSNAAQLQASVGQVPFNFQIGEDIRKVQLQKPATASGELTVRAGCEGEVLATLSLEPARQRFDVTALPSVILPPRANPTDLCFRFTQAKLDPLWVLDRVSITPAAQSKQ